MTNTSFQDAFQEACEDEELFGPEGPCPITVHAGNPRLVVVTGENASGKSFFTKFVRFCVDQKIEWLPVSMKTRTEPGLHRVFMFGDENRESTGSISVKAVLGGLRTCRQREAPHVLVLDEPDIGLSESYQKAMGVLLGEFGADMPDMTAGLVVVTHSRAMVREMLIANPTLVRVGDSRPVLDWVENGSPPAGPEDLESLSKRSAETSRAIQAIMNRRREATPGQKP